MLSCHGIKGMVLSGNQAGRQASCLTRSRGSHATLTREDPGCAGRNMMYVYLPGHMGRSGNERYGVEVSVQGTFFRKYEYMQPVTTFRVRAGKDVLT